MPARESNGDGPGHLVTRPPGQRARRNDPGIHVAEEGETVRVARELGARYRFLRYSSDSGGDFAIVIGGLPGHRIERCVTVDRIQPLRRRRTARVVRSEEAVED